MPSLKDDINAEERARALEVTCRTLQRQLASAKAKTADLVDAVERAARDAAVITGKAKPRVVKAHKSKGHDEVALLHLTDWQLGKQTATYNTEVCVDRVRVCISKTIRLVDIQRAAHPVRHIRVMLGGDMVENMVFPGAAFEIDSTTFEQCFAAAHLIEESLLTLLENFETVTVHQVNGNHGRIGKKGDNPRGDNWDRIIYTMVREKLSATISAGRLVWTTPVSWYDIVTIGNYSALLIHGDQIKSFGGNLPAFGISRKAIAWSSGAIPEDYSDTYMGHYHSSMELTIANGSRVFVTPSCESSSEYAREFVAAKGAPGQRLHMIDPRAGRVTSQHLIWLSND